jgi:uncharacterized damage-inducible protein DinB
VIRKFYEGWQTYNDRIVEVVAGLSDEQLLIRPAPERWPMWATIAHTAGVRVYWLCTILGECSAANTPFREMDKGIGWEDDESTPRVASELVMALASTWRLVAGCLDRWTPAMLSEAFPRGSGGAQTMHTRQSVLLRLLSHDAYHAGELSQTLGIHGLPQIDLWRPGK